jgi:hypothetical protein
MRTTFLLVALAAAIAFGSSSAMGQATRPAGALIPMKVYKTPTCGCCGLWVDHVKAAGFKPEVIDLPTLTLIKQNSGVPQRLGSCHTALVEGYVVEGHVPADVIHKLLKDRPQVTGIAVPGMPIGSPGMEQGSRKDPYDVLTFDKNGRTTVFASR